MERPSFEEYSAPGYTLITKLDNIDLGKPLDVTILLKNPKETYEVQTELKKHLIFNNSELKIRRLYKYVNIFVSWIFSLFFIVLSILPLAIIKLYAINY